MGITLDTNSDDWYDLQHIATTTTNSMSNPHARVFHIDDCRSAVRLLAGDARTGQRALGKTSAWGTEGRRIKWFDLVLKLVRVHF